MSGLCWRPLPFHGPPLKSMLTEPSFLRYPNHSPFSSSTNCNKTSKDCTKENVIDINPLPLYHITDKNRLLHVSSCSQIFERICPDASCPWFPCTPWGRRSEPRYGPTKASCPTPTVRGSIRLRPGSSTVRHVACPSRTQTVAPWSSGWPSASAPGPPTVWRDVTGTSQPRSSGLEK